MADITISKEALWELISSMSNDNKRWLAEKLRDDEGVVAKKRCGLDEALEDVKAGRVHTAESTEDLFKQILG